MDGWMVSVAFGLITLVSTFAVMRSSVTRMNVTLDKHEQQIADMSKSINSSDPIIRHLSKEEDRVIARINDHGDDITQLKERVNQAPTMKEVRTEFVSKELFLQMEKHIDGRFDGISDDLARILNEVRTK